VPTNEFACRAEWVGEGSAVVTVEGELDLETSSQLGEVLDDLAARGIARQLVIDLSPCAFVDSTGLGLLVAAQRRADAPLDLVVTNPQLLDLLELTALDQLFHVHETRSAALDSLQGRIGQLCSIAGGPIHTGAICR
jgi:anti-sigma B factor antagonist